MEPRSHKCDNPACEHHIEEEDDESVLMFAGWGINGIPVMFLLCPACSVVIALLHPTHLNWD
jgi:hypothetical protein